MHQNFRTAKAAPMKLHEREPRTKSQQNLKEEVIFQVPQSRRLKMSNCCTLTNNFKESKQSRGRIIPRNQKWQKCETVSQPQGPRQTKGTSEAQEGVARKAGGHPHIVRWLQIPKSQVRKREVRTDEPLCVHCWGTR